MRALLGPVLALAAFALAFALHIVGGLTDQDWLFAVAVAAIFLLAAGFPGVSMLLGRPVRRRERLATLAIGAVLGAGLMAGTLWAAGDRSWKPWTVPAAVAVAVVATAGAAFLPPGAGTTVPRPH